jgi:hypothetical protein
MIMVSALALVTALVVILCVAFALWRASRRIVSVGAGALEGVTVSRQWLLQHQSDDSR